MTYVMSDLHGMCGRYYRMLDTINLQADDTLYILGDVIDRGDGGVALLLAMMDDPRIVPIIGNHESLALPMMKTLWSGRPFEQVEMTRGYQAWMGMGGKSTAKAFHALDRETQRRLIDYIESFSLYKEVEAGGKAYHLSHTLPEYDPDRDVHDVTLSEFIWGEPNYETCYDPNVTFVTGHTPTPLIDPLGDGGVWRGNGHLAIDCGAPFEGGRLGCVCLETMEEFYS